MRLTIAVVLAALATTIAAGAAEPISASYHVGMARRDFVPATPFDWRGDPKHRLSALIWYPADQAAPEEPFLVGPPGRPYFDAGRVARDAALAPALHKFPLVLLSHGFGATAANMAWLGAALAARGYIAAAVNHPGNNAIDGLTIPGMTLWWLRARDLSAVIDGLLADPVFGPRIDEARIGAAGHSLGGYTVIEIAGGITSRAHFREACAALDADKQCQPPRRSPELRERVRALAERDPAYRAANKEVRSYRDRRVRAVFAMAPGLADAFLPDSLSRIEISVAIVAGAADEVVPVDKNAKFFAAKIPRAELTIFPAAMGHMVFAGICLPAGRAFLPSVCSDAPGVDRAAVEAQTAGLAAAFFTRHLQ